MPEGTSRPTLLQYGDLTAEHFAQHPVWVAVHSADYDEPWYDDADEETFRPWDGGLPVKPDEGLFLACAKLVLADGTVLAGFATPAPVATPDGAPDLGLMQPQVFLPDGSRRSFWQGIRPVDSNDHARFYAVLGRDAKDVFPLVFELDKGLASGCTGGEIRGFYYRKDLRGPPEVQL